MIGKPSGPTAGTLPLQIATTGQQGEGQRGYERGGQSNRNKRRMEQPGIVAQSIPRFFFRNVYLLDKTPNRKAS